MYAQEVKKKKKKKRIPMSKLPSEIQQKVQTTSLIESLTVRDHLSKELRKKPFPCKYTTNYSNNKTKESEWQLLQVKTVPIRNMKNCNIEMTVVHSDHE